MTDNKKRKGNILLVANWESDVGYAWWLMENFWVAISDHFESKDKISYLVYPKVTQVPKKIAASNIQVIEHNFHDHKLASLKALRKIIKDNGVTYVYLSDSPSYSMFYILLKLWGIKKIVVHDHTPGERTIPTGIKKNFKSFLQRIPFYTADHFISVTEYVKNRHIEVNCIPEKKCSVASNGIEPINLDKIEMKYAFNTFNIHDNKTIVVTTGRASYYKGIDFFIRCADELINKQGLKQLHFIFCGDGPDMKNFKLLCKDLSLNDYFTFTGKRTDIRKILPSCKIGFHASLGEVGYSLSILEYMSAGLATIVPDNPSTSCATINHETGVLYRQNSIDSACNAIKYCLDNKITKHLSYNATKEVTENYNINNTNTKLISILNNIYI